MKQEWEAYWDNYRFPDTFMRSEIEPFNNPVRVLIAKTAEKDNSVLDVGSASCISAPLFKDKEYVGVDFTLNFLKVAKQNKVTVVQGYALQLPFKDEAFDSAFIKDVFEHMHPDAYKTVIAEMWRVAKHQIMLAFYGHLNKAKTEMLREPDEPDYKGGLYYFNAYCKQNIIDVITNLPSFSSCQIIENIQRENCDEKGRVMVIARKMEKC